MDRLSSFIKVVLVYIIALVAASLIVLELQLGSLLVVFVADCTATVLVFVFSTLLGNGSVYDPYWSVLPPVIAGYWVVVAEEGANAIRQGLCVGVCVVWALRLTYNWASQWQGLAHEDWRYVMLRQSSGRCFFLVNLLGIHLVPTLLVFAGMLGMFVALVPNANALTPLDVLAVIIGLSAPMLQGAADTQMKAYRKATYKNKPLVMRTGVWAYSRHPNYLAEIMFWIAMYIFGLAADASAWWWTLPGPLGMIVLFVFASIPMTERHMLENPKRRQAFMDYKSEVPTLIPLPKFLR